MPLLHVGEFAFSNSAMNTRTPELSALITLFTRFPLHHACVGSDACPGNKRRSRSQRQMRLSFS